MAEPEKEEPDEEKEEEVDDDEEDVKSSPMIDNANIAAERVEKATKNLKTQLDRQEVIKAEETLGGTADAGAGQKEDTPKEYAEKVMRGDIDEDGKD